MKKFLFLPLFIIICSISYSQNIYTQKQLENAGFKSKTAKKIISKYNGDVESAFNKWAESGSGSLGKKSAKAALQLGINKSFVDSRLKQAKKVRAMIIAAALSGAAAGYAEGMQKQSEIQSESMRRQNEILQNSSYSRPYGSSSFSNPSSSYQLNGFDNSSFNKINSNSINADGGNNNDGIFDQFDNDADNDGIFNQFDNDRDNDGIFNQFDNDDGVTDSGFGNNFKSVKSYGGKIYYYRGNQKIGYSTKNFSGQLIYYDMNGRKLGSKFPWKK